MSRSLSITDMHYVTTILQTALGITWTQIPVKIWYKRTEKISINFWTLLTFQTNGQYGYTINFQVIGIDKTKKTIDIYIGIPYKIKRARFIGKCDEMSFYLKTLLNTN